MSIKKNKTFKEFYSLTEINFSDNEDITNRYFEVLRVGKKVYQGEVLEITNQMLSDFEEHFKNNIVGTQLALDVNHDPEHVAFAWIDDVKVEGDSLMMKFKDFTEEGEDLIKNKKFKYFSVEFNTLFDQVINGVKKTFKNVLRGVALTNRPVDKAIAPTFFNEDNFITNNNNMFKVVLADLQSRSKVTKEDISLLKNLFAELSDDEQTEVTTQVEELEAKVEEVVEETTKEEETTDEVVETPETEKEEEEEKEEEKPKGTGDGEALAEKEYSKKFAEMQSELDKFKNQARRHEFSEKVAKLTLSENAKNGRSVGFTSNDSDEVVNFMLGLSEKKAQDFLDLLSKIKTVDFNEYGFAGKLEEVDALSEAEKAEMEYVNNHLESKKK